ncbi:hypothetical protein KFE98_05610 [bacterium SCSIO 12741]|nr:hypothetical protein KFE98_05610 [bacterium SCSIO 12741]
MGVIRRLGLLVALLGLTLSVASQGYHRKKKDAFPPQPTYEKSHWYFGPGVTYTWSPFSKKTVDGTSVPDTSFHSDLSQQARIGLAAEFGRYHLINKLYFFRYWNYGVNYRWIQAKERYTDRMTASGENTTIGTGENSFSDHFINAHVEISGINKLSDYAFLQHTLGATAGYAIGSKRTYSDHLPGLTETTNGRFHSYLYYKLGWGYKVNKKSIIIPSLEIPLLNIANWNNGRMETPYFNSQYWPWTLSVRILLARPYRMKNCPPVDAIGVPDGFDPGGE